MIVLHCRLLAISPEYIPTSNLLPTPTATKANPTDYSDTRFPHAKYDRPRSQWAKLKATQLEFHTTTESYHFFHIVCTLTNGSEMRSVL